MIGARAIGLVLAAALAAAGFAALPAAASADDGWSIVGDVRVAAKQKPKKKAVKKKCKKTRVLRKGKCVKRKAKPKPKPKPPVTPPAPNLSDADGDGIPYQWEVAPASTPKTVTPKRCTSKQRLLKGRCVPKCKKGRTLKRGKCVKKKAKKKSAKKGKRAQAALATASVGLLGANPNHKDIFVQIDYANAGIRANLDCAELDALVAAFAAAPVSNPDGQPGIALHLDAGKTCPSRSYDLGGSRVFNAGACPSTSATFNALNLEESRVGTFHISGFVPICGQQGAAGVGDLHGLKSAVYTEGGAFAHVFMHELGHNLGLDHPFPGQPNRLSVMNSILLRSATGSGSTDVLDYQRISLPALDENNLDETAGISAPPEVHDFYIPHFCAADNSGNGGYRFTWPGDGPIDWNCNSPQPLLPPDFLETIDPGPLPPTDVNGDGQKSVLPATGPEWGTLDYGSGGGIGPR